MQREHSLTGQEGGDEALINDVALTDADDAAHDADAAPPADSNAEAEAAAAAARERARRLGWKDKADYIARGGRESAWIDAPDFLDFRERVDLARGRENVRLERENRELRDELRQITERIERQEKFQGEFTQARTEVQESSLWGERRGALEQGDYDRVNAIDKQIMDLRTARQAPVQPSPQSQQNQQIDPRAKEMLDEFAEDYPVYRDKIMQSVLARSMVLALQGDPTLRDRALLDEAHDIAQRVWANKFKSPAQRPSAPMAAVNGAPSGSRGSAQRTWGDLKSDVRTALEGMIRSDPSLSAMKPADAKALILKGADDTYFASR